MCRSRCAVGTYSSAYGATANSTCQLCGPNAFTQDSNQTDVTACWCNIGYAGVGTLP